ncbi:MAG: phosphatidylinositol-specific phospholipase C domain-containing protein [Nostoc sp.]|uniref:phosphatidylinositol-specific phospholipase C domain-containing protein n=1 Tax=Nostoc sp. TaxID=1180 RepID=UPI002FF6C76F
MFDRLSRRQFVKITGGFVTGVTAAGSAPLIEILRANAANQAGYKVVGYFENWSQYRSGGGKFLPEQIDASLFTHINFAFGIFGFITKSVNPSNPSLTGNYTIEPVEWNDQTVLYPAIQKLKQKNPNLKTLLSIGGWSFNDPQDPNQIGTYTSNLFSQMAATSAGRQQFISSAIQYAKKYGFDGIDLDWEYPGYSGRGGKPEDIPNFLKLVEEFRSAISGNNLLLTMASPAIVPSGVPAQYHSNPQSYFKWLAECAQYFDWLNVMSYDYHGAFPNEKVTGMNAPLPEDSTLGGKFSVKNTVEAYLNAEIPTSKIVLGLPSYGRSFNVSSPLSLASNGPGKSYSSAGPAGVATGIPGILAYYEIADRIATGDLKRQWDQSTMTPYAYKSQNGEWISYDDAESIGYKTSYLIEQGLAGAMYWAIGLDKFQAGFPLIKTTKSILANPSSRPKLPAALVKIPKGPHSWMDKLSDSKKISKINIPGTHETCALYGIGAICQDRTLIEQLEAGIRFIDIRCRHFDNNFAIHHDKVYQNLNFHEGVRDVCIEFLKANPSEFIVMLIKPEYEETNNTRTFQETFDSYIEGNEEFWYFDDRIPTVKEVRGKIVLLSRFGGNKGIDALPWADNATFDIVKNGGTLKIQDEYKFNFFIDDTIGDSVLTGIGDILSPQNIAVGIGLMISSKWEKITNLLDRSKSDASDNWYINYTSAWSINGFSGVFANSINPQVYDYLGAENFSNRLGTFAMDFPDNNMINRIISLNK